MYVLMVVPSDFPNGDAGAVRDIAFAKIYQELGYSVILIGAGRNKKHGEYQGVEYFSVFEEARGRVGHIKRFLHSKRKFTSLIRQVVSNRGFPILIHINDVSHAVIGFLVNMAKMQNIIIVHDSTEWYSPCEFKNGRWDKQYILKNRLNTKVIREPIKVIGISSYLTEYFISRDLKAIRVPVIMDVKNTPVALSDDNTVVRIIYAGNPGKKDYVEEVLLGFDALSEASKKHFELHILGLTKEQVCSVLKTSDVPKNIIVYGRVKREIVEQVLLKMDFSVLLRPQEERYAKAGFPTKTVEAMAHGVAMICNISSDLGMYLIDGVNSIIVDGCDSNSFLHSLNRIAGLQNERIQEIKNNARKLALTNFDYRSFTNDISAFLFENKKVD